MTAGPGLAGALLVGDAGAKALALALDKPIYAVNHLAAHVAVDQLEHGRLPEPCLALLVSGGHSSLLLVRDVTGDDRALGPHPRRRCGRGLRQGRPAPRSAVPGRSARRSRGARWATRAAIAFPRGLTAPKDQAAHRVRLLLQRAEDRGRTLGRAGACSDGAPVSVPDVAASFQEAVVDVLATKTVAAARAERDRARGHRRAGWLPTRACVRSPRTGVLRRGCSCGCPDPGCAPTTGRWWRPSARSSSVEVCRRAASITRPTRPCRSPRSSASQRVDEEGQVGRVADPGEDQGGGRPVAGQPQVVAELLRATTATPRFLTTTSPNPRARRAARIRLRAKGSSSTTSKTRPYGVDGGDLAGHVGDGRVDAGAQRCGRQAAATRPARSRLRPARQPSADRADRGRGSCPSSVRVTPDGSRVARRVTCGVASGPCQRHASRTSPASDTHSASTPGGAARAGSPAPPSPRSRGPARPRSRRS